jgi:exodeoxyribonuclease X
MADTLFRTRVIRVIDFESTGKEDPAETDIIEVGWCDVHEEQRGWWFGTHSSCLVKPTRPIETEAKAIHHLTEAQLVDGFPRDEALSAARHVIHGSCDLIAFAAHGAKFEQSMWPEAGLPWIDTYKLALRLWPDSPRHSLQVLRYYTNLPVSNFQALPAHRAGPDAYVGAALLSKCLEHISLDEALDWSARQAILPRVTFGQHRGKRWSEMDDGFLDWVVVRDFNEDVLATASHEIARRGEAREKERAAMYAEDEDG